MMYFLIVLALLVLWLVLAYNGLVRTRTRAQEAYSDIDVQLKRRYDLIPNLVESVKGYMAHEAGVFEKVTQARSQAMQATGAAKAGAENALSGALKSLFAVAENYPQLKSNENFLRLQDELAGTENRIAVERRKYNEALQRYNTSIALFPDNLVAGMSGMARNDAYFQTEPGARTAPKVQF